MSTVTALRRAVAGAPPPLSACRQRLADAITAQQAGRDRTALLETAQGRARIAWQAADDALTAAREASQQAMARAHERSLAALLGNPPPAIPTRAQAAATLQAATDAADDADAALRAIAAEIETLHVVGRDHADRIAEAAQAVLAEEGQEAVKTLIGELEMLHRQVVDRQQALAWLIRGGVVFDAGPKAAPGTLELTSRSTHPMQSWSVWRAASPTAAKWQAALDALKADPGAAVP